LHAEGGTGIDHAVCVARSKDILGPWKGKPGNPILTHRHLGRKAAIINVGHADLFDDTLGDWWMVLLASRQFYRPEFYPSSGTAKTGSEGQGVCPLGRETFLVPVRWHEDWPYIASDSGGVEWDVPIPAYPDKNEDQIPGAVAAYPESACDHFNYGNSAVAGGAVNNSWKLPPAWLALRMPQKGEDAAYSLLERPGYLRLFARASGMRDKGHPGFAGRRIQHKNWFFSTSLEFFPKEDNECAGLILIQNENYQYRFEMCRIAGYPGNDAIKSELSLRIIRAAGKDDEVLIVVPCPDFENSQNDVSLINPDGRKPLILAAKSEDLVVSFYYGTDQYSLLKMPLTVDGSILSTEYSGGFVGILAGIFATGNGKTSSNYADVKWAEYRSLN
jgi:alpha-N-arabinofuranosidase